MLNDLLIWVALLVGLVFLVVDKRRRIGALTLAYFLALSLGHVPGLLAYLDPDLLGDAEATKVGFDVTLIGMTAFIVGAMAARILPQRTTSVKAYQQTVSADILSRLGWRVLTIGIVCLLCGFAGFGAGAVIDSHHLGLGVASHSWLLGSTLLRRRPQTTAGGHC